MSTVLPSGFSAARPWRSLFLALGLCALLFGGSSCAATGRTPEARVAQDEEASEFDEFDDFGEFDDFQDEDEFGEFDDEEEYGTYDPLEGFNRGVHWFNDRFFRWVLDPVARGWRWMTPDGFRIALARSFTNATTPVRVINGLLQLELGKTLAELGRFAINSTVGVLGFFDPADAWLGWTAPPPEDFGQTLATYGVGEGFPLVLPFLGPMNLRDAFGLLPDSYLNPSFYFLSTEAGLGFTAVRTVNTTSLNIGQYQVLTQDALDPYVYLRDAYQQNRQKQIDE